MLSHWLSLSYNIRLYVIYWSLIISFCRNSKKAGGTDSKFFTTNRKGENHELREELRSPQRDRKRDAVKKVCKFCSAFTILQPVLIQLVYAIFTGHRQYDNWKGRIHIVHRRD